MLIVKKAISFYSQHYFFHKVIDCYTLIIDEILSRIFHMVQLIIGELLHVMSLLFSAV